MKSPVTFCISTFNNFTYLVKAVESIRKYSYYKDAPFIIHAENCNDGTNEWLEKNKDKYNLEIYIEQNEVFSSSFCHFEQNFAAQTELRHYLRSL